MQTSFSPAQLKNPATAEAEKILRTCVHCGFCNATCPTFVLLGAVLPYPNRFRLALAVAPLARSFNSLYPRFGRTGLRLAAMLRVAPKNIASPTALPRGNAVSASGAAVARVALLGGCVQQALR